jgi:hypothetical protein
VSFPVSRCLSGYFSPNSASIWISGFFDFVLVKVSGLLCCNPVTGVGNCDLVVYVDDVIWELEGISILPEGGMRSSLANFSLEAIS